MDQKPAVVLLSGGLDSATVLAMAKAEGFACYALSFDYGNSGIGTSWMLQVAVARQLGGGTASGRND